jgi:predicted RNA binding protein YcfA (HicA-like mRNA interferase family)
MSPHGVPSLKPREVIRILERMGFVQRPNKPKGSHRQFEHPDGRRTTVPVHAGRDVGPGLLRKILRDIELDPSDLRDWL